MKTICWNSHGLGNPLEIRALRDLITRKGLDLLFLQETKLTVRGMEACKFKLGFTNCFSIDSVGRSGGLSLIWNSDLGVELKSFSRYHIDVHIKTEDLWEWRFTGLYGNPEVSSRCSTWNLIRTLNSIEQIPWLLGGNFNEVLHLHEKRGGRPRSITQIGVFREVLTDCNLRDLGFRGPRFTWWNGREGDGHISKRLDRYLGNSLFCCLFPQAVVLHGTVAYSDHLPVMFESLCCRDRPLMKKQFRFEAIWVGEERCEQIINQVWRNRGATFGMEEVLNLIKGCGEELTSWNRVSFGQVRRKLNEARNELEKLQLLNSCHPFPGGLSMARKEVQLWLERNEVMWRQRSRVQWLKEGDQNTRYFHSKAFFRK
ncbi:uncharacterized protein LOC121247264 [Juglans microcarpa x Juglans regia]|uniref:uncharacterized protein LOC121247264 n=1 Tax=Juglans microcarpa x Juglans regia TaxID=2249226 RepID=UPI001B7E17E1|nr:uncharacterized protein LOC121247264 [Juglans microcarpa x Juglans regia]